MHGRFPLAIALALMFVSRTAAAQDPLAARLDSVTLRAVMQRVEMARAEGLPVEPLRNKALEGASKSASGPQIEAAVDRLLERLRQGRATLGDRASTPELVAAAAVLDLGVESSALGVLHRAAPDRSIASALVGLAFLVQRGAQADRSTALLEGMLQARASDADFARFQTLVEQDVRAGAPITGAAHARARAFIEHGGRVRAPSSEPFPR